MGVSSMHDSFCEVAIVHAESIWITETYSFDVLLKVFFIWFSESLCEQAVQWTCGYFHLINNIVI